MGAKLHMPECTEKHFMTFWLSRFCKKETCTNKSWTAVRFLLNSIIVHFLKFFTSENVLMWIFLRRSIVRLYLETFQDLKTGYQGSLKTQRPPAWHTHPSSHPRICWFRDIPQNGYIRLGCDIVPHVCQYFMIFSSPDPAKAQLHFLFFSTNENQNSKTWSSSKPCS